MEDTSPISASSLFEPFNKKTFSLTVLTPLFDKVTLIKHNLTVENINSPQLKDLYGAIAELYPVLDKSNYSLYARYGKKDLIQIANYLTMITAFKLLQTYNSPLLYMIRKDLDEKLDTGGGDKRPSGAIASFTLDESDIALILTECRGDEVFARTETGRPEHKPQTKILVEPKPVVKSKDASDSL